MALTVKGFATLDKFTPPAGELPHKEGRTLADLFAELQIDPAAVKVVFVNGVHAEADRILHDGDRVGIFPAVGGG